MKVLVADDSEIVRRRVVDMVKTLPSVESTTEANDTSEALGVIKASKFDVVILDISMPGGGGIEVLKQLKTINHSAVVIMLTNYPYEEYRQQCQIEGANYFFDKTKDFQKVVDVMLGLGRRSN
ncbi:MAG: response regulator transcription factor [Kiritimatiellae bacterium]|nr:response regulator transcription factor [Kiritimatiellia bacterium]MDD5520575.1 response regulator transcription factor [Kiritimatiellia bacterium]